MSFNQFAPNIWRGPKPQTKEILQRFQVVINLQSETIEAPYVWQERDWCKQLGIEFHHVGMSLITPPTKDQLIEVLGHLVNAAVPTYIHCAEGVDRTGISVAFYENHKNHRGFGDVIGEAIDMGFHLDRYCWWLPIVRQYFE